MKKKLKKKRELKKTERKITMNELEMIEKEIERNVYKKIFDSNQYYQNIKDSEFERIMRNQSHVIILIETTENQKSGCYILKEINQKSSYIEDSESFLFQFDSNGNRIEKYVINESSFSIEISNNIDDNLFVIGKNDIVIKKKRNEK